MLLLGYILVIRHKNNIVTLHVTFMIYRRNETCLLGNMLVNFLKIDRSMCTFFFNFPKTIFDLYN